MLLDSQPFGFRISGLNTVDAAVLIAIPLLLGLLAATLLQKAAHGGSAGVFAVPVSVGYLHAPELNDRRNLSIFSIFRIESAFGSVFFFAAVAVYVGIGCRRHVVFAVFAEASDGLVQR